MPPPSANSSTDGVFSAYRDPAEGSIIIVSVILGMLVFALLVAGLMHWRRGTSGEGSSILLSVSKEREPNPSSAPATDLGSVQVHLPVTKEAFTSNRGVHGFSFTRANQVAPPPPALNFPTRLRNTANFSWVSANWNKLSLQTKRGSNNTDGQSSFMDL
ncbi:hypothetical protein V5O48_004474 [Marasmius crinis-equi]|uniref:Uncharacterized protein n=1 Tax=Marasmius crinis-equi TaxID=585013 RepID=A0ABR3FQR7_9AGAR